MMAEYIEREVATNVACNILWKMNSPSTSVMAKALNSIPAADVAPVRHGVWERIPGIPYPRCSLCRVMTHWNNFVPRYCDACGAKMDGDTGAT